MSADFDHNDPESWRIKPPAHNVEWVFEVSPQYADLYHWLTMGGSLDDYIAAQRESETAVTLAKAILLNP